MKAYRSWLPATSFEAICSLGGSFDSSDIHDYYLTPYELGYGIFVKFDHDFIGREALEKIVQGAAEEKGHLCLECRGCDQDLPFALRATAIPTSTSTFPNGNYAFFSYDQIVLHGRTVGISMYAGYSYNERSMLSLGVVDADVEIGTEVELLWGEKDGGTVETDR